ncbi:AraC family transcriptional regulator [Pseudomonas sp. JS3066]|uniref:AraC-like transcriptional regulator QhpR n=1 Tax=Pseudomonas sp. JS3066 TaxID=3090665 RepID=UPI002E7C1BE1|nr:AraC family transcriptional regulator [Pseudomonas sp. JS3066]WVK91072.1 AraC family transcriptional regulator [Pseudomonas sp. JS3066]
MTSFVRGIALLGFEDFARSQALDPHALLAEVGLPVDDLDGPISGERFAALLELCAARTDNLLFGLQFGIHQGTHALGDLLYVIISASSLGDALEALIRYYHVHSSGAELRLERHGHEVRLRFDVTDADAASVRQTVELAMAVALRLIQTLIGRDWKPNELLMRHAPVEKAGVYRALLGIAPRFDNPVNALVFDSTLLAARLSASDERFQRLIRRHFDELAHLNLQELPHYVQKLLRNRLPSGNVTVEQIAEQMMLSPRTLQRYLQTEGTSFQQLLDSTRQSMAIRYLRDSSISLTQLSALLGYTSLGAFSRAFSRWTGTSPQKWKQQHRRPMQASSGTAP